MKETSLVLLTRGTEVECPSAVYRPAIESPPMAPSNSEVVAGSIVAQLPRRWKKERGCKVRTPAGDFVITAVPQADKTVRLEGKNIAAVAAALHLKR
jgi:hypothetical protein